MRITSSSSIPWARKSARQAQTRPPSPRAASTHEQKIAVKRPQLWSLEDRNLYTLVTEVRVRRRSGRSPRHHLRHSLYPVRSRQGTSPQRKSIKLKGTCNHQDHAGLGAALPDAVQYYRIRKLQEMGCNSLRTSHNPPTPECSTLAMNSACWSLTKRA